MDIAWEEQPFEWVHEREHRVLRRYTKGPLAWLENHVTLTARPDGGTDLVHEIQAAPRGTLGKLSAFWEIRWKMGRKLDAAYRRMDAAARQPSEIQVDPFEPPHAPSPSQSQRVAAGIERLASLPDRRFAREIVDRLRDLLLTAPDKRIERIRPYALADAWGAPRAEVLDLLLFGANVGLVDIAWDLVCPGCYVAHETAPSLREIAQQASCAACGEAYSRDLVGSVELIFRPHREVRDIETAVYCTGSPAMRSHVLAQQILAPRERRSIALSLARSDVLVRVERRPLSAELSSSPAGLSPSCEVHIGADRVDASPAIVRAGPVEVRLVNDTDEHHVVRIERPPQKADSVTAAAAMTHPTFQAFFSDELLREGEHLRVSHLAFVAIDVDDRANVLRELGDPAAFARFSALSEKVLDVVAEHRGTVFRAGFELTLAAFVGGGGGGAGGGRGGDRRTRRRLPVSCASGRTRGQVHRGVSWGADGVLRRDDRADRGAARGRGAGVCRGVLRDRRRRGGAAGDPRDRGRTQGGDEPPRGLRGPPGDAAAAVRAPIATLVGRGLMKTGRA